MVSVWCSPGIPMADRSICRCLAPYTAARRSSCATRSDGTVWATRRSTSAGVLARLSCRGDFGARPKFPASNWSPITFKGSRTPIRPVDVVLKRHLGLSRSFVRGRLSPSSMRAVDLIRRKRDSGELTPEEIRFLIDGYTRGDIPDYQMSAWLMAVVLRA